MKLQIADMHCDLLSYLQEAQDADATRPGDIGCNIPALKAGNVRMQVMAIYTATEAGSTASAFKQSLLFKQLPQRYTSELSFSADVGKIQIIAAIENAAGLCEESGPFEDTIIQLNRIAENIGDPLYIGLTHHTENRFGGGNTTNIGLKEDGKRLLDHMQERGIAIDFSHTSDALAYDILHYLDSRRLQIPVLASHSNFRAVFQHPRNLPDDIASEIIRRNGVIGMNFLRAFVNDKDADALYAHIAHGLGLGGEKAICFGADFFYTARHPDQSRRPFFFPEHEDASKYPGVLERMQSMVSAEIVENIAHRNALDFVARVKNFRANPIAL